MFRPMYGQAAYRNACQFCHGKGCFDCDVKGKRAMDEAFQDPIRLRTDSKSDMAKMSDLLNVTSITELIQKAHDLRDEQLNEEKA